jgi:CBS-domain-containing membrane protein
MVLDRCVVLEVRSGEVMTPSRRTLRTAIQALVGLVAAVPVAAVAATQAGVEVPTDLIILFTGISAAFTVLASAVANAWDIYNGNG